jgi:hypothetical protein
VANPELSHQPVPAEEGPRISRLTGKVIEPVKKPPTITVSIELAEKPFIDTDGAPIARRAQPKPELITGGADDAHLGVLERGVQHDEAGERAELDRVRDQVREILKPVRETVDAVDEFSKANLGYLRRVAAVLANGQLLAAAGNGSRERISRLHGRVQGLLRVLNGASGIEGYVQKLINEVDGETAAPKQTSLSTGRDGYRSPAITDAMRFAGQWRLDGVMRDLNEQMEVVRHIVKEISDRISERTVQGLLDNVGPKTELLSPETLERREAGRPTPRYNFAVNSIDENGNPSSDWNPLDYSPRRD